MSWRDMTEVWQDDVYESGCCNAEVHGGYATACEGQECPSCGKAAAWFPLPALEGGDGEPAWDRCTDALIRAGLMKPDHTDIRRGWFWWTCCPGCLPDSDAFGPFETEDAAWEDADPGYEEPPEDTGDGWR